jgi:hypothetical protein
VAGRRIVAIPAPLPGSDAFGIGNRCFRHPQYLKASAPGWTLTSNFQVAAANAGAPDWEGRHDVALRRERASRRCGIANGA